MAWELLAIWLIVTVAVTWFVRDEKRRIAEADLARAARYYAFSPKYRYGRSDLRNAPVLPRPTTGGLTQAQRGFFQALING